MMGKHALLFALFTALSVILCSADCAEHFNSIYKVKTKKFKILKQHIFVIFYLLNTIFMI